MVLRTNNVIRLLFLFIFGLATSRIVYEWSFPRLLWLARPFPTIILALIITALGWLLLQHVRSPLSLLPLLLNLYYLFDPTVDLLASRLIFFASVWLTAVFVIHSRQTIRPFPWFGLIFILLSLFPIYLLTMPHTVGRADTFEFQVVAPQLGIAHPTGYPLYLLLAKLFTFLPISTIAWRINFASVIFTLTALTMVYLILLQFDYKPIFALLGALAIGLTPTLWSQAIEAEVYALHGLVVTVGLWFMLQIGDWRVEMGDWRLALILAGWIGLGLTNHLTTVFLIPAGTVAILFALRKYGSWTDIYRLLITDYWLLPKLLLAGLSPLLLYAYLPLRWTAVNEDTMGWQRFFDWVVGGRFQDALQWRAWLDDPTRWQVVSRIFLDNWGSLNLIIAAIGLIYLAKTHRHSALLLFVTWLGFAFYALNYYVPDLAVFTIPAQIITGIWWACGGMGILALCNWIVRQYGIRDQIIIQLPHYLIAALLFVLILPPIIPNWSTVDRSTEDGLTQWGTAVLQQPLAQNSVILADSEKIAPLYYLQQAEGVRSDLDIMVLPNEAAYRAELDGRIANQTIYLARFLPGLEGIYHLRSVGPLTEVSPEPMTILPSTATPQTVNFGEIELLGYELEEVYETGQTAVTLYWQTDSPIAHQNHVYLRWEELGIETSGQHPANNYYPTNAWRVGEIVSDFHLIPNPIATGSQQRALQVALAPPFTTSDELDWKFVAVLDIPPHSEIVDSRPLRIQIDSSALNSIQSPISIRPQTPLILNTTSFGHTDNVRYELVPTLPEPTAVSNYQMTPDNDSPYLGFEIEQAVLETGGVENGRYHLIAHAETGAICGWLQSPTTHCVVGEVEISGVSLSPSATNYADKIALLNVQIDDPQLQAGGQFPLTLEWQSLAPIPEDYTIFIQILDDQDRIVGQIDAWPLQGTLPTSQWPVGEIINDPHLVQLAPDLPTGNYRLIIGWYLLADFGRLPVLDETGQPIEDKLTVANIFAP